MTHDPEKNNPPGPASSDPPRAQVIDPINMARARHAGASPSTLPVNPRQPAAAKSPVAKKEAAPAQPGQLIPAWGGMHGCLLGLLFGLVFMAGSVLGGLVGGGMLLWLGRPNSAAWLAPAASPTLPVMPTPAPAATVTPVPTPAPVATPAAEDIIAQIIPSVVTVINQHMMGFAYNDDGRVVGSGVIVDSRGYIATNNHVVESPGELRVILADGREVAAELVSADPAEDLAVVRVPVEGLPAIQWGSSASVRLGQAVYAIGSPLGDFPSSVSFGIISGLNRALEMDEHVIDGLIQTDAAINRGSSGGPLINTQGEMIGINTFIIRESEDRGIAEGIAFAIPVDTARNLLLPWIAAHRGEAVPIPAAGEADN